MTNREKARRLRKAAEFIFNEPWRHSCGSIERAFLTIMPVPLSAVHCAILLKNEYGEIFSPNEQHDYGYWLDESFSGLNEEEQGDWRVWALCFAAAMAESGDL